MLGGVGIRRGRRDPQHLRVGDSLDFWRVEGLEPQKHLRLYAEMILPGKAWLEFNLSEKDGKTFFTQDALFVARFIGISFRHSTSLSFLRWGAIFLKLPVNLSQRKSHTFA